MIRDFLEAADADGDKRVSLSEYVDVVAHRASSALSKEEEEALRRQFALLDNNGDGYISKSELRAAAKAIPTASKYLLEVFARADLDGDGTISFEEFVQLM
jgi:Ca2+-binding EF-hand superfamily protein